MYTVNSGVGVGGGGGGAGGAGGAAGAAGAGHDDANKDNDISTWFPAYKRIHIELFKSVLRVVINNAIDLKYS